MKERSFTRVQNFAQNLAKFYKLKYLIFQHNDCYVKDDRLIHDMINTSKDNPDVGVVFTYYDALALFNMSIINAVGCWDESFYWYESDIDFYQRILMDNYKQISIGGDRIHHYISQTLQHLTADESNKVRHNHNWAKKHYIHKWGGYKDNEKYRIPYNANP